MRYQDWSEFWWTNITGAHLVVSRVVNALTEQGTVMLEIPADLPWRHEMRSAAEDEFRKTTGNSDMIIEVVDATDDVPEGTAPGSFLLERFAPNKEVRNGYRARSQRSLQTYLTENDVLKNRVIWVKGLSEGQSAEWIAFCREFRRSSVENGSFVLEVQGGAPKQSDSRLCAVRTLDCISGYDVQLLGSFIAEEKKALSAEWKRYLSTAAAMICDTDAEIAAQLLERIDVRSQSPLDVIAELEAEGQYDMRGADAEHVFALLRNQNQKELRQRLWKAQVKTLFPLIEIERIRIIENNRDSIQYTLDNKHVEQYHEKLTEPIQVELGTLCYMIDKYSTIRDKETTDRVRFLHICRNHLAHAHPCSTDEVCGLLDDCAL